MAIPQIPTIANPKLFDRVIGLININLVNELPWLSYAFGQAERQTRKTGDKLAIYPSVYAGKNINHEYVSVLPDERFGAEVPIRGFSFFEVGPAKIDSANIHAPSKYSAEGGVVFWFNLEKVLGDSSEYRNWDKVIDDIIKALRKSSKGFNGQLLPNGYTKKDSEIYKGYTLRDIEQKFLMSPFAGVRINCSLIFDDIC